MRNNGINPHSLEIPRNNSPEIQEYVRNEIADPGWMPLMAKTLNPHFSFFSHFSVCSSFHLYFFHFLWIFVHSFIFYLCVLSFYIVNYFVSAVFHLTLLENGWICRAWCCRTSWSVVWLWVVLSSGHSSYSSESSESSYSAESKTEIKWVDRWKTLIFRLVYGN